MESLGQDTEYAGETERMRESTHENSIQNNNTLYIECAQRALLYKSIRTGRSTDTYFNAHKWVSTLTPKYIPSWNICPPASWFTHRFAHRFAHPIYAPIQPNRSVQIDPVLGLHNRSGQCWACISTYSYIAWPMKTLALTLSLVLSTKALGLKAKGDKLCISER